MPADDELLLIDAHAASRARLEAMLQSQGYSVRRVEKIEAVLGSWDSAARPAVILATRGTPARAAVGVSALREQLPEAVIVAIGAGSLAGALAAWRAGADAYVARPVRETDLLEAVRHALELRARPAIGAAQLSALEARVARLEADRAAWIRAGASPALRQLARDLAHEINNPLTPILGMAEMLVQELPAGHIGHEYARSIIDAALRIRDVVRSLVAVAESET
jgi:DNA-binding NtrC family response regulator